MISSKLNKYKNTSGNYGSINDEADYIYVNRENIIDKAKSDNGYRLKKLKDIERLLNSQELSVTNRDILMSLKSKLEEREKYIDKISPYLKPEQVKSDTELPIDDNKNPFIITTPNGEKIDTSTEFPFAPPRSYEEYLTLKQNSTILTENMGGKKAGYAAHHIVPASDKNAQIARDVFKKYGFDINDSINGVFLPTESTYANNEIIHKGRHPVEYSKEVSRIISNADVLGGQKEVEFKLIEIRNELLNAKSNRKNWFDVLKGIK